jgi:hypothetical protein
MASQEYYDWVNQQVNQWNAKNNPQHPIPNNYWQTNGLGNGYSAGYYSSYIVQPASAVAAAPPHEIEIMKFHDHLAGVASNEDRKLHHI